jgi:hypothetical protein
VLKTDGFKEKRLRGWWEDELRMGGGDINHYKGSKTESNRIYWRGRG